MADDDQDRISSLPEGILHRILSRLPTVSVVRTSVLSKRWSRVWASISRLDFIEAWLHRCKIKLLEFMDNFLQHRDPDAAITRLRLCMQYDFEVVASSRLLYGCLSRIDMKTLRWLYLFVQESDPVLQVLEAGNLESVSYYGNRVTSHTMAKFAACSKIRVLSLSEVGIKGWQNV